MNSLALLRVFILKEVRTTFRERAQLRGLIVSVVVMLIAISGSLSNARRFEPRHVPAIAQSAPAVPAAPAPPQDIAAERWFAIGGGAFAGFFFSLGYLISATLSSFVGEREGRTLEILLSSPLSNGRLFLFKSISVLVPSAAAGCIFAGILAIVLIGFLHVVTASPVLILTAVFLAPPIMILPQLWFVGLGAAISVRAETMKGAAQVLSVFMLIIIFGSAYGIPMLLRNFPGLQAPIMTFIRQWLALSFPIQYASVLLVLGTVAAVFLTIGRTSFRRDRMLT
jgi:ABC-type Na+ efflux pump permease subunit